MVVAGIHTYTEIYQSVLGLMQFSHLIVFNSYFSWKYELEGIYLKVNEVSEFHTTHQVTATKEQQKNWTHLRLCTDCPMNKTAYVVSEGDGYSQ